VSQEVKCTEKDRIIVAINNLVFMSLYLIIILRYLFDRKGSEQEIQT